MHGAFEIFGWNFWKTRRAFLERRVLDRVAGEIAPALDPAPAEMTIAVEKHQRFRRRGAHSAMGRGRHQCPTFNVNKSGATLEVAFLKSRKLKTCATLRRS